MLICPPGHSGNVQNNIAHFVWVGRADIMWIGPLQHSWSPKKSSFFYQNAYLRDQKVPTHQGQQKLSNGPTNYINMIYNGYSEIWSVSDTKTYSGAKQEPKLTWGGQSWSFCTLCSPTNLFYTKIVNFEMVTSRSYFLAWNRPEYY